MDQQLEQTIIKAGLELTPFNAEAEIQKFPIKAEDLTALAARFSGLTINGLPDKEGYHAVSEARKILKAKRVEVAGIGKDSRDGAIKFQRMVIAKEKALIALIEPTEDKLLTLEREWERHKDEAELEEKRKESERIQGMLAKLNAVEFAVDIFDLQAMNESQFEEILVKATSEFEITKAVREATRLAVEEQEQKERDAAAAKERQAEIERETERVMLEIRRHQQEEERLKLEKEQAAFRAEQERIQKENAELADLVRRGQIELAEQQAELKRQRTRTRDERLKGLGMREHALGMVYKHEHNPGQVLCGRAHIMDLTDEGFEEHIEMMSKHVEAFRLVGEDNRQRWEAEQAASKLIREEEEKKEKQLRMSDSDRFIDIREKIEDALTQHGFQEMQSTWGQLAISKVASLLREALQICKANETSK